MILVIGSGPAAIAATHALVQQGHRVTILDVGTRLETDRQKIVDRMSKQDPLSWESDDLKKLLVARSVTAETNHSKLSYGSSFSFDTRSAAVGIHWDGSAGFKHSLARGGLSNVWGATLLAYRQQDINDWPIRIEDLEPHYQAVMDFVPSTAIKDGLEEIIPNYSTQKNSLDPSRQGQAFLKDLEAKRLQLRKSGIFFGKSRLAIRAAKDKNHRECAKCGLCLNGCPYGLIYSSAQTLDELIQTDSIDYLENHLVEKFEQIEDEVVVSGHNLATKAPFSYQASRVFVGAGVLPTAKIVLNSLQVFDQSIQLLDSQYFIYPILRFSTTDDVETERMHTSSQAFIEIDDKHISKHLVHLQIYGYSSFLLDELTRSILGWTLRWSPFRRQLLGRLLIAQGFMHSKESGSVTLTLSKADDGEISLNAKIQKSRMALITTLKVGWKLLKQSFKIRALPIVPGLHFFDPGSSYHSGGTFPMRAKPQSLETDILGRLPSIDRVHLVDSSVLPSIPGGSITFTVMANAHRIATLAGQIDSR